MQLWNNFRNILVIRADNMGDVIMSGPAIKALKKTLSCKITLFTSAMGNLIAPYLPCVDEVIVSTIPWVKNKEQIDASKFQELIETLHQKQFDAAVIFTVYSQNPMPAAMLAYLAGIKHVLSYCRENPYDLISNWVPEKEPYTLIKHQVQRDLELVRSIGIDTEDDNLQLQICKEADEKLHQKLIAQGIDISQGFIVLHPGVSERKREYPIDCWIEAGKQLAFKTGKQLLITGAASEKELANRIETAIGNIAKSVAGLLSIEELVALIQKAELLISVNTGTVHIAAAMQTPVVVLYALTNPQHTPWKTPCRVLPFKVDNDLKSKNEVVAFVSALLDKKQVPFPTPIDIVQAAEALLSGKETTPNTEIINY